MKCKNTSLFICIRLWNIGPQKMYIVPLFVLLLRSLTSTVSYIGRPCCMCKAKTRGPMCIIWYFQCWYYFCSCQIMTKSQDKCHRIIAFLLYICTCNRYFYKFFGMVHPTDIWHIWLLMSYFQDVCHRTFSLYMMRGHIMIPLDI